ncbi:MAG: ERCC4 domain-containing protein [Candidatus Saccharicenans sp.]
METAFWVLEATGHSKFPYRIRIVKGEENLLCLRVQDRWPGTKGHIFCLREDPQGTLYPAQEIERVPVISLKQYGKRLAVVLDRTLNKRCEFLFLKKKYKQKEGEYEQIFWRTRSNLIQRKIRSKLTARGWPELHIAIDKSERYPWNFAGCRVERRTLPAGDYALITQDGLRAVVERKTFENLIGEFGRMPLLHQALGELEAYRYSALVIEANYADFLNPKKLRFYKPSFASRALAELQALHPNLIIVFAGNRKLAREWTLQFFTAVVALERDRLPDRVNEALLKYEPELDFKGGSYFELRAKILKELPEEFSRQDLQQHFPEIEKKTLRRVLADLIKEGQLQAAGAGKSRRWLKTSPAQNQTK